MSKRKEMSKREEIFNQIKERTKDLCSIASVSDDSVMLHKAIDYIAQTYQKTQGLSVIKKEYNQKPSLIIQNFVGKHADIVLNGHIDVVRHSQEGQYRPAERDGKIYARGAGDMKSGVACMMAVMKKVAEESYKEKKISLIITSDEEIGGEDGARAVVEEGFGGDIVLIPDGGSRKEIIIGEKGLYRCEIKCIGKSVHSARPRLGENAIDSIISIYSALKKELEDNNILYQTDHHRGSSVNLNIIQGGTEGNVLPNKVSATIDIRFTEKYNLLNIKEKVKKLCQKHNGSLESEVQGEVLYTDIKDRAVQHYKICAQKHEKDVFLSKEDGASDGRFFAERGAKVILHRPTCANIHGAEEYVHEEDFLFIYDCFYDFIMTWKT